MYAATVHVRTQEAIQVLEDVMSMYAAKENKKYAAEAMKAAPQPGPAFGA